LLACDSEVAAVDPVAATLSQQSSPDGSAEPSVQPLAEAGPASFRPQAGFPDEIAAGLATARREFAETVAQSPQAAAPAGLFSGGEELIDPTRMTDRPFFFPPGAYYGAVVRNTSLETLAQPADEAVVTNLVLSHDVSIEVLPQGDFTATWQTRTLQPAGTLYYGVTMPDQHFAVPRYRRESTVLPSGLTSRTHSATGSIATLARPNYDIAGFAANGSGIVEIRAEQFIVELGSSRLYDRRFAFDIQDDGTYRRVPVVSEGPFLDLSGGPGAFTISFDTDAPVNAFVAVWTTEAGLTTIPSPQTNALHHEVPVQLGADTSFYYAVGLRGSGDISTVERWWPARSHAAESTPFRFAVMSDSRSGVGAGEHAYEGTNMRTLRQFMAAIWSEGASFMVFPGDLADGYVSERVDLELQLRAWKDSSEILGRLIPIFEGMGNHEALAEMLVNGRQLDRTDGNSAEAVFASEFVNPLNGPQPESDDAPPYIENVYSWDWGNSHFVMLNSNYWWTNLYAIPGADVGDTHNREGYVMDRQMEWLRADLDAARQRGARHIFAFTHEPPFPNGGHLGDTMWWNGQVPEVIQRRDELIATLLEYDVLAIITGDEHNYSRTLVDSRINPVWEGSLHAIVSGGCGAPYYARDLSAPWAASVQKFSGQQHFNLIDVDGDRVVLTVIGESGEVIEEVDLTAQAP
jgi:3',5'-cyclic AMP phosphodiesterase CpdA